MSKVWRLREGYDRRSETIRLFQSINAGTIIIDIEIRDGDLRLATEWRGEEKRYGLKAELYTLRITSF